MRIVRRKHRVDTGQLCMRGDTAGRVAVQDQPARRLGAKLQRRVVESIPAPRGSGIVAADECEAVTALSDEMSRHGDAGIVIVEPRNGVDRCRRKVPRFCDGNSRAPQQPRTVFRGGRAHHDDRLGAPRQQCREHVIFTSSVVARLRQDHGVAERLQFVGQALHRIGKDRVGDRRHQHTDRAGPGPGQRDRKLVRHIAEFPHRGFDPTPCCRRHQLRQAHHAAHGNRRYAGQFGYGRQSRCGMGLFGACVAHLDGH
jgi:hypothetical protein